MKLEKALIIKKEWLDLILLGKKTFEVRGGNTKIRGRIGLIESGSGLIVGECELINSLMIDNGNIKDVLTKSCIVNEEIISVMYKNPHAWELNNALKYNQPLKYKHPKGAIIWIDLKKQDIDL
jgi:hypothetical protein